jgi:hypothetical protein
MSRKTVKSIACVAATLATCAVVAAPASAQSSALYVLNNSDYKARAYYHADVNNLCVELYQGYSASATIWKNGVGIGTKVDYGAGNGEVCLNGAPLDTENGKQYRMTLTWRGTGGAVKTEEKWVDG